MKTHRVLNRLSKCANARYGKSQVFLWFTINSQSKLLVCNFIKKETLAQMFSCEFCEISKNTFSYRTSLVAASEKRLRHWCFPVNFVKILRILCLQTTVSQNMKAYI